MKQIDISKIKKQLKKILGKYKNYKNFSQDKKRAYEYAELFNIKVCPYCNINYIYTVTNSSQQIVRPDFDHFSAKSENPKDQLNVDNLIPSCNVCNSRLKRDKIFTEQTHLHPFKKDFDLIAKFNIDIKNPNYLDKNAFNIVFDKRGNASQSDYNLAENNIKDFKLTERYEHHKDAAVEVFDELKYYHNAKLQEIENLIKPSVNSAETSFALSRILKYKAIDINNTSLGKLKKDIVDAHS